jgi:hypothetical protein
MALMDGKLRAIGDAMLGGKVRIEEKEEGRERGEEGVARDERKGKRSLLRRELARDAL